jgi:hypothetical protein
LNGVMKTILTGILIFCGGLVSTAQTRIYVSTGLVGTAGGNINTLLAKERFGHGCMEIELERKMMGPFHSLIGLSYFRVGYFSEEDLFGSMSRFRGNYLVMPVMLRFNVADRNQIYLDAGPSPYVLMKAHEADITRYSNRFFMAFRFQATFAFGRFTISEYLMWQGEGNSSTKNLADHWFLNAQESTYLLSRGYSDFFLFGFKVGMRIK